MNPLLLGDGVALLRPLWLLAALALVALALLARRPPAHGGWRRVMSPAVLAWLGGDDGTRRGARVDLALAAAALVALALAAPATRRSDGDTWRHSSGWIALADVSRSMTLDDTLPSRLAAMRETLLALSSHAGARPLALILYAGDAFLVAPFAFDRRLVDEHTALLEHGSVPLDGSNLVRALALAASVAVDADLARARVFVLGDSGGSGKAAEAAAGHLADAGHRVDVILFGGDGSASSPGPVPTPASALAVDVEASTRLARAGAGRLVRADALGAVPLDALGLDRDEDPADVAALSVVLWQDRSHWLLLVLLPLMLALFRRERV